LNKALFLKQLHKSLLQIAESVNTSVQRHFPDDRVQIIAEPGRFFVAAAYTLVCKIHAKREIRDEAGRLDTVMYYLNDGVYGSFNCILYDHQVVTAEHYLVSTKILIILNFAIQNVP